ncbi:hypothetical protein [Flavobacterium sp.]|uniref:hypothetical protein n=1 Tax=Flavobacterium sp. TaxID=239 RepID=UPI00286E49BD|nr:hypothetical protein [Flavobacterium sp.]
MKKIVVSFFLVVFTSTFAQDVKIKDGIVFLDKKEIAKIATEKFVYKVSSLDDSYSITITKKFVELPSPITWLEMKDEKQNLSNEFNFEKFSPFGIEKSVIKTMIIKDFLNANGLNTATINAFLTGEKNNISEKYLGNQNKIEEENKLADSYNLIIDDLGNVKKSGNDIILCRIELILNQNQGVEKYIVTDKKNNIIATWLPKMATYPGYKEFLNEEIILSTRKFLKLNLTIAVILLDTK